MLLGLNFDFLGGCLVGTARYLVVTARYLVVTGIYCLLLVVTACHRSLLLVPTFSMRVFMMHFTHNIKRDINISSLLRLLLKVCI